MDLSSSYARQDLWCLTVSALRKHLTTLTGFSPPLGHLNRSCHLPWNRPLLLLLRHFPLSQRPTTSTLASWLQSETWRSSLGRSLVSMVLWRSTPVAMPVQMLCLPMVCLSGIQMLRSMNELMSSTMASWEVLIDRLMGWVRLVHCEKKNQAAARMRLSGSVLRQCNLGGDLREEHMMTPLAVMSMMAWMAQLKMAAEKGR